MSIRNKPYRDKDKNKRSVLLEKESEKLRKEITELEDALILHSRFEGERDQSVRGLIRKELGGSHWEYGGEGKVRTFRSQKDLSEEAKRNGKETHQVKRSRQSEGKRLYSHTSNKTKVPKSFLNTLPVRNAGLSSQKSETAIEESNSKIDSEISCIKAEWNLSQIHKSLTNAKDSPIVENPNVKRHTQEENSIRDLKSKVLTKATAKILNKLGFSKSNSLQKDVSQSIQNISQKNKPAIESQSSSTPTMKARNEVGIESFQLFCGKQALKGGTDEKDSFKKTQSCYHHKSKLSVANQRPNQDEPTYLSNMDEVLDNRNNMIDLCETKSTVQEYSNNKNTSNLNSTLPQFPHKNSSVLSSHSNKSSSSDNVLVTQPVTETAMESELSGDVVQNGKIAVSSDGKSTPLNEEVLTWLENLGLHATQDYVDLFAHHQMDMASVRLLTSTQLREMGIHALGPIMKIIKGVQILGRRNSIDDVDQSTTVENDSKDNKNTEESNSSHKKHVEALSSGTFTELKIKDTLDSSYQRSAENDLLASLNEHRIYKKSPRENNTKPERPVSFNSGQTKKKSLQSAEAGWKETFDEAEFLNLNDRSPITDLDVPLAVTVREKATSSRHTKSQKKSEQPRKTKSKSSRKPPPMMTIGKATDDGVTSAAQKYTEKQKQQNLKEQAEGRSTARRREKRDEMAARHLVRRRSSSFDRDLSTSTPKPSLQRSSSFTNKDKKMPIDSEKELSDHLVIRSDNIEQDLKTENEKRQEGHQKDEMKMEEIVSVMKALPDDGLKTQDESQLLTLGVVRELQKQLNDLEQHLVQTKDGQCIVNKPCPEENADLSLNGIALAQESHTGPQSLQMAGNGKDSSKEILFDRKSARERRREKQVIKTRENYDERHIETNSEVFRASTENNESSKIVLKSDEPSTNTSILIGHKIPFSLNDSVPESHTVKSTDQGLKMNDVDPRDLFKHSQYTYKPRKAPRTIRPQNIGFEDRLNKIEIDKRDISFERKDLLGEGVFSQVFKGKYQGSQVAVKLLRAPLLSVDKNYFSAEVSLLQELRHPHVVMLLGVCTSHPQPLMVLELMEGGNLFDHLHNYSLPHLSKSDVYQISHDVASGVSYLHHHRPPVLHLDLKSRNILLGFRNRAKIADFGFSKLKHEADIKISRASKPRALPGSPAWMAPELLAAGEITAKADVYSFAIVMWEMITRQHPYEGFSMFQILEHVRLKRRPQLPSGYPQKLIQLITKCWEQNPAARPNFKDVLKSLEAVFLDFEWVDWPQDLAYGELDENDAISKRKGLKKGDNNARQRVTVNEVDEREVISQDEKDVDVSVSTTMWDNMDVRSISFDDVEHLEHDDDNSNIDVNNHVEEKQGDDKEEQLHSEYQIKTESDDDNFSETCIQLKPREPSEETPIPPQESHIRLSANRISTLPVASPRLVPSPRIREMAKKQAVERNSSVFISLSHAVDQGSEVKADSTTPRKAAVYPHEDEKLETLMQKYLPSPRNKALIKQRPIVHHGNMTDKLLPLRQSLNKPRKPPKPDKPQNLSTFSKSLNFDLSSTTLEGVVELENTENQLSEERLKASPLAQQQSKLQETLNKPSGDTGNESLFRSLDDRMEVQAVSLPPTDLPSFQQHARHAKNPAFKSIENSKHHSEDSYKVLSKSFSENKSDESLTSLNITVNNEDQEDMNVVSPKIIGKTSSRKCSPSLNSYESTFLQTDVKNNEFDTISDKCDEAKNVTKSEDEVKKRRQDNISSSTQENISLQDNEGMKDNKISLPFLFELQSKSTIKKTEEPSDNNGKHLNLYSNNTGALSVSIPHLDLDCVDKSDGHILSIPQSNAILPVSHQPFQPSDSQQDIYSDSESSIYTDFSADSLSVTLSDDDDSIYSLKVTGSDQNANNSHTKKRTHKGKHADDVFYINRTSDAKSLSVQMPKASQKQKYRQDCVRESFFLFDDFQLVNDAKENVGKIEDMSKGHEMMNTSSKPTNLVKFNELSFNPSVLNIKGAEFNSSLPKVQEKKQPLKDDLRSKTCHEKKKPCQLKTNSEQQKIHKPHQFKRFDDANFSVEERHHMPHWPAPPVSHDEPNIRPLRTVQFSLEASMLVNQKKQLKSVAVHGDPHLVGTKEANKSMPSVATILKKAIEERRFALGDNLESQDITPEASWSIQD